MANKATKDLLVLGALGAAVAAGYFYYERENEKDLVPEGCQPQTKNDSPDKSDGKPISTSGGGGTEAEIKKEEK